MKKMLIASVTYKGELTIIKRDCYETKKAFYEDLRGNGYSVRFIATEETFDDECYKWHRKCERNKAISKAITENNRRLRER